MKRDDFSLALDALLPGCDPEAASKWAEFANECVESGQFVHFIPAEHDAAVEKWLDAVFVGLCDVKQEYGPEIAAKVAELSCQRCALYPGEMLQAARVLENGGAGMDGVFLQTGKLYAPVRGADGQPRAFQEVKAVTAQEREAAFLAGQGDALAIYRPMFTPAPKGFASLARMQESGDSPLRGNYDLIHTAPLTPGNDHNQTLEAYRAAGAMKPGDIAAFKQAGVVTCWYMDQLANSKLPGLLAGRLKASPPRDVEEVIAGMRAETIRCIRDGASRPESQLAWYWTYIGSLDMAQQLGLIDDARRQALYREARQFKPACEVKPLHERKPENHLAAAEMGTEQNYNQIDGVINNEAPKPPSLRDTLKRCREEVDRSKGGDAPGKPRQGQDR